MRREFFEFYCLSRAVLLTFVFIYFSATRRIYAFVYAKSLVINIVYTFSSPDRSSRTRNIVAIAICIACFCCIGGEGSVSNVVIYYSLMQSFNEEENSSKNDSFYCALQHMTSIRLMRKQNIYIHDRFLLSNFERMNTVKIKLLFNRGALATNILNRTSILHQRKKELYILLSSR